MSESECETPRPRTDAEEDRFVISAARWGKEGVDFVLSTRKDNTQCRYNRVFVYKLNKGDNTVDVSNLFIYYFNMLLQ